MRTLNENYKAYTLLSPANLTSTGQGSAVQIEENSLDDAMAIMVVGAVSGTTPTLNMEIHTSDASGGTYTEAATFGEVTAATKLGAVQVNLDGRNSNGEEQKYVRADYTIGGSTPNFQVCVVLLVKAATGQSGLNNSTPA